MTVTTNKRSIEWGQGICPREQTMASPIPSSLVEFIYHTLIPHTERSES